MEQDHASLERPIDDYESQYEDNEKVVNPKLSSVKSKRKDSISINSSEYLDEEERLEILAKRRILRDKKEKKDKSDKEVAPKVAKNVESDNDSSDFESDAEVKPVKKVRETLEERLIRQGKAKPGEVK